MTLGEAKKRVLLLLDESKPKNDLTSKLDRFFDMGQKEVALYYPIYKIKPYFDDDDRVLPECGGGNDRAFSHRILFLCIPSREYPDACVSGDMAG